MTEDDTLILQSQTDPQVFQGLYSKYFRTIFLFVIHRVGEKELAADITQQVFLKALTNIGKYQLRGSPFLSWLYRIAINECNDLFRKSKRIRTVVLDDVSVEAVYEEATTNNTLDEWKRKLPSILEKLKPEELHVVELRFFEGRPFREIAEILDITETYAKVRTYRILNRIKKLFSQMK